LEQIFLIGNPILLYSFFFNFNFFGTGDNGGHSGHGSGEKSTPKDNGHNKPTPGKFLQIFFDNFF
jgi:hypothetical protein